MTTTSFSHVSINRAPAAARTSGLGTKIWNVLTRLAALRAAAQLRRLARQHDALRPELSRHLREAAQHGLNG